VREDIVVFERASAEAEGPKDKALEEEKKLELES